MQRVIVDVLAVGLVLAACGSPYSAAGPNGPQSDGGSDDDPPEVAGATPEWLQDARVVVSAPDDPYRDCRSQLCRHNENTDLVRFGNALWFVHRSAVGQGLGPNSALHVQKSSDDGAHFDETAFLPAPADRDVRDPHFYTTGDVLHIKAITRLPVVSTRDSYVDTVSVETHSTDGITWSPFAPIGPARQGFWRVKEHGGTFYSAAYDDGDANVTLFTSPDGTTWTKGAVVFGSEADTPSETELVFMPSGKLLALVRVDGTSDEMLGNRGRLRTLACWADPPAYAAFQCPQTLDGVRLDGPLAFFHDERLFVVARKHLQGTGKKRTALFEIGGVLEGGPLTWKEWGELPSAGDTSYAGIAMRSDGRALLSWYSGRLAKDEPWALGMFGVTNVWHAVLDFSKLH